LKQQATAPKKHSTKATKPKATPTVPAAPKAPVQRSAVIAALAAGLPNAVATALGRHQTVVVSLYNPYSEVDGIAFAEARAGAKIAGVGFVPLNVLSEAQVGSLTQMLGLLPDPGLLVYIRPGTLVARISGFADKETVAQAAQNAARGT
jgi:glucose/arabinose dehydrogenase